MNTKTIAMLLAVKPIGLLCLSHLLVVCCFIPLCFGLHDEEEDPFNDYIIASIILSVTSLVDVVSYLFLENTYDTRRTVVRHRNSVNSIFRELGPYYVRRSYRMREVDFWNLLDLISPYIPKNKKHNKKRKRGKDHYPNGKIHNSLRLSIAIRYFAGASPYDLMVIHGVGMTDVYKSIWLIVDAVNLCPSFRIVFPTCHEQQKNIAEGFRAKSWVDFDNCVGAVDGILIWMNKPSSHILKKAGLGVKKFFCGRKKRYGLNMQAICDHQRRFIYIDISHPASTSDYLSFGTSSICKLLESPGFLAPGLTIYGDNAYVNTPVMTSPFKAVTSGIRDAYNFYHSQLRINIECAFGMLVNRWSILHTPIAINISLAKTTSMVRALCCLHNYLIDVNNNVSILYPTYSDSFHIMCNGGNPITSSNTNNGIEQSMEYDRSNMSSYLDGGEHFDDVNSDQRRNHLRSLFRRIHSNPREYLLEKLQMQGIDSRPAPLGSTSTNNN